MKHPLNHPFVSPLAVALVLLLSACGTSKVSDSPVDYGTPQAAESTRLDVPPDLSKLPNSQNRYAVPGQVVSANQARQNLPQSQQQIAPQVLGDVSFKREGKLAWISVKQPAEKVWPVVQSFWLDNGFTYTTEDAQAGILETEWAENRAKLPQDMVRKALGKLFDSLASTGEKDKYLTRVERTAQGVDIYIAHRGVEEVYTGGERVTDRTSTKWQARPSDPFLENEFLRRLMVKLGSSTEVAQAAVSSGNAVKQAALSTTNGKKVLTYQQPLNVAWRHVGLALDRVGFTIQDRDAARGLYYLRYIDPRVKEEPGFFKRTFTRTKKPEFPSEFRIQLSDANGTTQIQVLNNLGQPDASEDATLILQRLLESLQ